MSTIINWLSALAVRFNPSGNIAATNVQSAIEELDNETVKTTGNQTIDGNKTFNNTITFGLLLQLSRAAGNSRDISFTTSGSNRWRIRANSTIESGADSGTNFELIAFNDTGNSIDTPLSIVRAANGAITFNRPINSTNTTISTSTTTGALTVAGGIGVAGNGFFGGNLTINNPSLLESSLRITSNLPGVSGSATNGTVASLRLEGGGGFGNEAFRARITARHESLVAVLGTRLSFFTRATAFGSDNENMALTASGNLLVGTTTDNGTDRLQVAGSVNATQYRLSSLNTAPASATATGTTGEIRVTSTHIFVCIAPNTWVRAALTTW